MSDMTLPPDCPAIHPVQVHRVPPEGGRLRKDVVVRAYEVYCHVYGKQDAMMSAKSGCRGGFGTGEIIAFLYARTFPKDQWAARVDEALTDMRL